MDKKTDLSCDQCGYIANNKHLIERHRRCVHERIRAFSCQQCVTFSTCYKYELKQHVMTVHEGRRDHKCDQCSYETSRAYHLRQHKDNVHYKISRPNKPGVMCDQCSYVARNLSRITRHKKAVHEKVKDLGCDLCDFKTFYKLELTRHVAAVHEGSRKFKCGLCEYSSRGNPQLQHHMKKVHHVTVVEREERLQEKHLVAVDSSRSSGSSSFVDGRFLNLENGVSDRETLSVYEACDALHVGDLESPNLLNPKQELQGKDDARRSSVNACDEKLEVVDAELDRERYSCVWCSDFQPERLGKDEMESHLREDHNLTLKEYFEVNQFFSRETSDEKFLMSDVISI